MSVTAATVRAAVVRAAAISVASVGGGCCDCCADDGPVTPPDPRIIVLAIDGDLVAIDGELVRF